jgi:hypothetical protein
MEIRVSERREDIGDSFPGAAWPGEIRYVLMKMRLPAREVLGESPRFTQGFRDRGCA